MEEGEKTEVDHLRAGANAFAKGRSGEAREHFEAAIFEYESCEDKPVELAEAVLGIARILELEEKFQDAEKMFERGLSILDQSVEPFSPHHLAALREVAMFHHIQQNLDRSEQVYLKLLELEEECRPNTLEIVGTMVSMAELYCDQGGYAQAVHVLRRALALEEELLGKEHAAVAQTCSDLASCLAGIGRYAEAEAYEKCAFQIFRKVLGPESTKTTSSMKRTLDLQEKVRRQEAMTKVDVSWQG